MNECKGIFYHPALDLIPLQRLEQRLKIAFTKAFVPPALDELKEHWAELGLGEDLQ